MSLHEDEPTVGGSSASSGDVREGGPIITTAGTASTLSGGVTIGPSMSIGGTATGGVMAIGGGTTIGGTAIGGAMPLGGMTASGGTAMVGGMPDGGTATVGGMPDGGTDGGTMAVGGSMNGGPGTEEHSQCLMVGGPHGCCQQSTVADQPPHAINSFFENGKPTSVDCSSTACGPLDDLGSGPVRCGGSEARPPNRPADCGTYTLSDVDDCTLLGFGTLGDRFPCGSAGLQCEAGLYYCRYDYYCAQLPSACAGNAASCACYESVYGPPVPGPDGWSCTDLGPGKISIHMNY